MCRCFVWCLLFSLQLSSLVFPLRTISSQLNGSIPIRLSLTSLLSKTSTKRHCSRFLVLFTYPSSERLPWPCWSAIWWGYMNNFIRRTIILQLTKSLVAPKTPTKLEALFGAFGCRLIRLLYWLLFWQCNYWKSNFIIFTWLLKVVHMLLFLGVEKRNKHIITSDISKHFIFYHHCFFSNDVIQYLIILSDHEYFSILGCFAE